jgi:chorismate mutase
LAASQVTSRVTSQLTGAVKNLIDSLMAGYWVRGIRGATTVERDEPELVLEATRELLEAMLRENDITDFEVIAAIFFTTTHDLTSTFPAEAARRLGMNMVPLICNLEIPVPNRLPRAVRVMMQVNTQKSQREMKHVYLRGAVSLRPDLVSAQ